MVEAREEEEKEYEEGTEDRGGLDRLGARGMSTKTEGRARPGRRGDGAASTTAEEEEEGAVGLKEKELDRAETEVGNDLREKGES